MCSNKYTRYLFFSPYRRHLHNLAQLGESNNKVVRDGNRRDRFGGVADNVATRIY